MEINSRSALIDNDFLSHALELKYRTEQEIEAIFIQVFVDLELDPMIHPLIFKYEVPDFERVKNFFSKDIVKQPTLNDIHKDDDAKKTYYSILVPELYKKLKGSALNMGKDDVFTFWKRNESLGEIHSIVTCLITNCEMFLSDDGDLKELQKIVEDSSYGIVKVHNREDVVNLIKEKGTKLSRKDLKSFSHEI